MQIFLRKYGTSGTIDFPLYSTDGSTLLTSAVFSSGCCVISMNEGTSALAINIPTIRSNGFSLDIDSAEISTKRLFVRLVDNHATKGWLDTSFVVETYGTSAAQHADIASGLLASLVDTISLQQLLTELLAGISGNIVESGDTYAYLARDNSTTVFTMSAGDSMRVRVL